MKHILKQSIKVMLMISFVTIFIGCEKGPKFDIVTYPAPIPSSIGPASGYPASDVTISGKDFGSLKNAVTVLFGGIKADTIRSCTDNQIVVKVPANALSGKVSLKIWTHTIDSVGKFTVIPPPVITGVVSRGPFGTGVAAPGDIVTIRGTGFVNGVTSLTVDFNGTPASVNTPVQDTVFTVVAPNGYASGVVNVTVNGLKIKGLPILNPQAKGDVSVFYLKNYQKPFIASTSQGTADGSWGILKNWTATAPVLNHNGYGGWRTVPNSGNGDVLSVEAGWGAPAIVNGKLYQTTTLPAGNYTFSYTSLNDHYTDPVYLCVAEGSTLPDVTNVSSSTTLGFTKTVSQMQWAGNFNYTQQCSFTLTKTTQVSLGFVLNMLILSDGEFFRISSVKLTSN